MAISTAAWVALGLYLAYCLAMLLFVLYFHRKMRFLLRHEITQNVHLPAFQRNDYPRWNRLYFFLGAVTLLPVRVFCLLVVIGLFYLIIKVLPWLFCLCDLSQKQSRAFICIVSFIARVVNRLVLFFFGFYWIQEEELEADEEDARYFYNFGENSYSTVIANHVHFLDGVFFCASSVRPCFIANISVKSYPVMGFICQVFQTIFVDRSDQESKIQAVRDLQSRIQRIKKDPNGTPDQLSTN